MHIPSRAIRPPDGFHETVKIAQIHALRAWHFYMKDLEHIATAIYLADARVRWVNPSIWFMPGAGFIYSFFSTSNAILKRSGAVMVSEYCNFLWRQR